MFWEPRARDSAANPQASDHIIGRSISTATLTVLDTTRGARAPLVARLVRLAFGLRRIAGLSGVAVADGDVANRYDRCMPFCKQNGEDEWSYEDWIKHHAFGASLEIKRTRRLVSLARRVGALLATVENRRRPATKTAGEPLQEVYFLI